MAAFSSIIYTLKIYLGEFILFGAYVIFAFCMIGCAMHAFYLGRRTGITATVEHLIEIGVLQVDDEE